MSVPELQGLHEVGIGKQTCILSLWVNQIADPEFGSRSFGRRLFSWQECVQRASEIYNFCCSLLFVPAVHE